MKPSPTHPARRRSGFTLLELLLASLIALLLLAALYTAMNMTLTQTQASRDAVEVDNRSRGVFNRLAIDLSATLGPLPPKSGGNSAVGGSSGSSMSTGTSTSSPASTTPPTPDPTAAPTPDPTTTADPTSTGAPMTPQAADIAFQGGVIGQSDRLTVFISRLPGSLANGGELLNPSDPNAQSPSDLWRITYWVGQSGGLCRQERPWVTADGVRDSADPDLTDETGDTIVEEVSAVSFEYFDGQGQTWMTSWDGTAPGPDGVTPIGPPRAVRATLTFTGIPSASGKSEPAKTVSQVIPIRSAPGSMTPTMIEPSTDPETVTADTSGGTTPPGGATSGAAGGQGAGAAGGMGLGGGATGPGGGRGGGGATPAAGGGRGGAGGGNAAGGGGRGGAGAAPPSVNRGTGAAGGGGRGAGGGATGGGGAAAPGGAGGGRGGGGR